MPPEQTPHYTPGDDPASHPPVCPLCATLDRVARPMTCHLDLRDDALMTRWHCDHCQAIYTFPEPVADRPARFGEPVLA